MGKGIKLALLILLIVTAFLSITTPSFGQDASGELYYGGISLSFSGHLTTTAGSCQQVASDTISCQVPEGAQGVVDLTATRSPAGAVTIRAVFLPAGWPDFSVASGWGTVTPKYTFTVPTGSAGQRFELKFGAWTPGIVGEVQLKFILDVVSPKLPEIEVSPTSLDFGEIAVDTTAELELTIKNLGDADLWVGNVAIKGGASSPFDLCGEVWGPYTYLLVAPGQSTKLTVCFSPKTVGLFQDELTISSNDPTTPTVAIPVRGSAVLPKLPKIEVSPTSLDFGEMPVNTTAELELTIKNLGDADLWVGNVAIKGGANSPFDLCGEIWTAYPLPPGEAIKLTVCFSPKTTGLFKDEVLINSNDPTTPAVTIPVQGNATKKNSTISCTAMGRPKPGGRTYLHEGVREAEVIVTVEISPPHSAEYAVKITDANGGTHGPFTYKTDANGKDKRLLVVKGTLKDFKLEGTWKCEVSWKGDEEYEGASSQCEFKVSELGSYEGTKAAPTTAESNRIDITYNGFCTANCSNIKFIQVLTRTAVFLDRNKTSIKPSHLTPDWASKDSDTIEVDGRFFTVDYLLRATKPYYPYCIRMGEHNARMVPATMVDVPWYPDGVFDNITKAQGGKNVIKVILEFETFPFCVDGTDKGKFYDGIKWRYEREKGEAGHGTVTGIEVVPEPSEGFKQALDKWCANPAHPFALPK